MVAREPVTAPRACAVTVLLPAYNESLAIERVLDEIVTTLGDELDYEILVVDDGSTDGTAQRAKDYAASCWQCPIRIVECHENRGAGAARKLGIRAAGGEIVVMLDADGSYPAASIKELLRWLPAFDQVNGARTSEQGTLAWLRRPVKWLIGRMACLLTGRRIADLNTGLKAFRRDAMLPWLWLIPDGFSCVTTMTLAFLISGRRVKYVPVEYRPRIGSSKFRPLGDTLAYVCTVLRIVLYLRPLRIFLPLAAMVLCGVVVLAANRMLRTGRGGPTEMLLLATSFMTFVCGLLAEVVAAHQRRDQESATISKMGGT
jgi:glycosyltransferase involved in cell wall biosynthesis